MEKNYVIYYNLNLNIVYVPFAYLNPATGLLACLLRNDILTLL